MLRYFTATLTFPSERSASKARPSNQLSLRSDFGSPLPLLKRGGNSSVASKPFAKLRGCVPFLVKDQPEDRRSVVSGKSVSVRVDLCGGGITNTQTSQSHICR